MDILPNTIKDIIFNYVDGDIINNIFTNDIKDKFDYRCLCENKNAIFFIKREIEYSEKNIFWNELSRNENLLYLSKNSIENFFEKYKNKFNWTYLSSNTKTVCLIDKYIEKIGYEHICGNMCINPIYCDKKIDWYKLCENKNAIHIIKKIIDKGENHSYYSKINWNILCRNENAIDILEKNIKKINWGNMMVNKNAIHLIEKNVEIRENQYNYCKIEYDLNENENAIQIIEKHLEKTDASLLCKNKKAIHIIEKILRDYREYKILGVIKQNYYKQMSIIDIFCKIQWKYLCDNENAVHIIENILEQNCVIELDWYKLCKNKNAISILKNIINDKDNIYYKKISWFGLSQNENIYQIITEKELDNCIWHHLCINKGFVKFLDKIIEKGKEEPYFKRINWKYLCKNENFWDKYNDRCLRKLYY